jgi:hypothetical protein
MESSSRHDARKPVEKYAIESIYRKSSYFGSSSASLCPKVWF